jgi:hypothetical protein
MKHQVMNDELAAASKELREACLAASGVEAIVLLEPDPGQRPTFAHSSGRPPANAPSP